MNDWSWWLHYKSVITSGKPYLNTDAVVLAKGAHFSLKQANDSTRRSGAFWKRKSSHFLLFIAPKKPLVILQKRDHEINAHLPSYMDGAHARLKRIASEWCDSPCSPDKKQTDTHTHTHTHERRLNVADPTHLEFKAKLPQIQRFTRSRCSLVWNSRMSTRLNKDLTLLR